jgi:dephospho-CoA kinase
MFAGKPIIGIVGGIGSGKSFVADLLKEQGCLVIHSDELVRDAYHLPEVKDALRLWWGPAVFGSDGQVNRRAIAQRVFDNADERERLEKLLHPIVDRRRGEIMAQNSGKSQVLAYVWDTPLLVETGLNSQCDAIIYVEASDALRLARLKASRGWDGAELIRRENLQLPLDKKREISEYVVVNTADADYARGQVEDVLSRIRGKWDPKPAGP